jgi:glycosyltransferase involved in cell wall biosynthesis
MVNNRDIIVFGIQNWDISSISRDTALEMAKRNRIIYVNPPLHRISALFHKKEPDIHNKLEIIKGRKLDLTKVGENMWVFYPRTIAESINWIKPPAIFDYFNKINDKRYAKEIKRVIAKLNFKNVILFNDTSMLTGFYLKELLKPHLFIYLLRDAVIEVPYHKRHGGRLQPLIIKKTDFTVTNSDWFAEYARQSNPKSFFIGSGCNLDRFNDKGGTLKIPDEIANIKKPIIGYLGFLTGIRLDIEVLIHIAEQKPEWNLVLVGPEDDAFKNSKLHKLNNVFFLGRKDPDKTPGYIKGFDVALNPQIVNEITDVNYPLKIDEYLAMGISTVATKTTFMNYFKDHTYLPATKEEYVIEIDKALKEDTPQLRKERIVYASGHSWENFVEKIYEQIEIIEAKK